MKLSTFVVLTALLFMVVSSLPSNSFTQKEFLKEKLMNYNSKDNLGSFYKTSSLNSLGFTTNESKETVCRDVSSFLSSKPESLKLLRATLQSAEHFDCPLRGMSNEVEKYLKTSLSSSITTTEDLHYATLSSIYLQNNGLVDIPASSYNKVLKTLGGRLNDEGLVRNKKGEKFVGTLYNTGISFQTAAAISEFQDVDEDAEFTISLFQDNVEDILEMFVETEEGIMFMDNGDSRNSYVVTNVLLNGVLALTGDSDVLEVELLDEIISHVTSNSPRNEVNDYYHYIKLIDFFQRSDLPLTMVFSMEKTAFASSNKNEGYIRVKVTDLMGNDLEDINVFLLKASSFFDETVIYSNQALTSNPNGVYSFNFFAGKPSQGFYSLEFSIHHDGEIRTTTRTIKVATSIKVNSVRIEVVDISDKDVIDSRNVKNGNQFSTFSASYYHGLNVNFNVKNEANNKAIKVQQAFLQFKGENAEVSFPVPYSSDGYKISLDMKRVGKEIGFESGSYTLALILGDTFIDNSIYWDMGVVDLLFPPSKSETKRESVYTQKEEIHHQFRLPEKRPSGSTSSIFTIGVLSPIAILLIGLLVVGIPFSSPGGTGSIFSILFFGLICLMFMNISGCWLGYYNMFSAVQQTGFLGIFAIVLGFLALKSRASSRAYREKQKSE